jgi:Tat protein translocase TatB subunit
MPEIGPMEILVVAIVALLVFGPEKLPEMARNVGRTISDLRRTAQEMREEFTSGLDDDEPPPPRKTRAPVSEDPDDDEDYVVEDPHDEPPAAQGPPSDEPGPQDPPDDPPDEVEEGLAPGTGRQPT